MFCNGKLLTNIRTTVITMTIRSHGGTKTTNLIGYLAKYLDPVYFDPKGIANILSLSNLKCHHHITYNNKGKISSPLTRNTVISFLKNAQRACIIMAWRTTTRFLPQLTKKRNLYKEAILKSQKSAKTPGRYRLPIH